MKYPVSETQTLVSITWVFHMAPDSYRDKKLTKYI